MPRRNPLQNIQTSGGLLTADFIQTLREENFKHDKTSPKSFSLPEIEIKTQDELNRTISEAWERLKGRWDEISLKLKEMNISESERQWILPILRELGFNIVHVSQNVQLKDESIQIYLSYRGWWEEDAPRIHTIPSKHDLDEKWPNDRNDRSPQDTLQLYLNLRKKGLKWGIVTNGILLRILREYYHTYTRGYIEFDLENIFYERNFTDFRTLFRLTHASRFRPIDGIVPLEKFYEESVAAGIKIGEDLRGNVKNAIELLGNGLLKRELRQAMTEDLELMKNFYHELLNIVYRILFLMFAEQRGMLPMHESLYAEEYSIARLREKSESKILQDAHTDLWYGLMSTFTLVREGNEDLNVFGYNGELFNDEKLKIISTLKCPNYVLLKAIRYLTCYEKSRVLQRINFLDIGVEEIGSIYESLLDFIPRVLKTAETIEEVVYHAGRFILDPRSAARKTTGSYYTDKRLINDLIKSSLKIVFEKTIATVISSVKEKEEAILKLKICDPACGSGAFLIAANNFLGKKLAQIRTGEELPSEMAERKARRDILSNCIYGVDLNPMALELAKVSLWINAAVQDLPLNFLDHHLKCGNSLIGTTPEMITKGINKSAFQAFKGEDKKIAQSLKRINRKQKETKAHLLDKFLVKTDEYYDTKEFAKLSKISEINKEGVTEKRKKYQELISRDNFKYQKFLYDTCTSVFFWPFIEEFKEAPTHGVFRLIVDHSFDAVDKKILTKIREIADNRFFFHWHLEFPEVFNTDNSGFDCILTNPPWERIKLQKNEFFMTKDPSIIKARSAAERDQKIRELTERNPILLKEFEIEWRFSKKFANFLRNSKLYPLTGAGDINTYSVFAERSKTLLNNSGCAGLILPSGIAFDYVNRNFFRNLVEKRNILSLFDFENYEKIFPDVAPRYRFCLLSITGSLQATNKSEFAFLLTNPNQINEEKRIFELTKEDFNLFNPNTKTCPIFRNKRDAELGRKVFSEISVLIKEGKDGHNPWELSFLRMVDTHNDAVLFKTKSDLIKEGYSPKGSIYSKNQTNYLPLYEGKMFYQFDHRYASITIDPSRPKRQAKAVLTTEEQHSDPCFFPKPRFWINTSDVKKRLRVDYNRNWLVGYKDITSASNKRTLLASFFPLVGATDTILLLIFNKMIKVEYILAFIANLNSLVLDYFTRMKIGGLHLKYYTFKQLPVLPPSKYNEENLELIANLTFRLVYTSEDLRSLAEEYGNKNLEPIIWNSEERLKLQSELNAIFFHLYHIEIDDVEYIINTFSGLKREEIAKYGSFRTRELVLQYYKSFQDKSSPINNHFAVL